jgi:hypothetical protein
LRGSAGAIDGGNLVEVDDNPGWTGHGILVGFPDRVWQRRPRGRAALYQRPLRTAIEGHAVELLRLNGHGNWRGVFRSRATETVKVDFWGGWRVSSGPFSVKVSLPYGRRNVCAMVVVTRLLKTTSIDSRVVYSIADTERGPSREARAMEAHFWGRVRMPRV